MFALFETMRICFSTFASDFVSFEDLLVKLDVPANAKLLLPNFRWNRFLTCALDFLTDPPRLGEAQKLNVTYIVTLQRKQFPELQLPDPEVSKDGRSVQSPTFVAKQAGQWRWLGPHDPVSSKVLVGLEQMFYFMYSRGKGGDSSDSMYTLTSSPSSSFCA